MFTDDDLKRFRIGLSGVLPEISHWAKSDLELLKALVARLSAAEACVKILAYTNDTPIAKEAVMNWLKSCGRGMND